MTWADPLAAQATDWSEVDFLNDLLRAINERGEAVGVTAYASVSAGDDVQDFQFIADLQAAVLNVCMKFQDPDTMDVTPGAIPANFTDAADWAGDQFTKARLFEEAGVVTDWTRKHPREISDTADAGTIGQRAWHVNVARKVYEHNGTTWVEATDQLNGPDTIEATDGACQAGDYIGPWIWNEMQDVLQVVSVVVYGEQGSVEIVNATSEADTDQEADSGGFKASPALAIAAADTSWDTADSFWHAIRPGKISAVDGAGGGTARAGAHHFKRTYTHTLQSGTYSYTQDAELVAKPEAAGFFGTTFEDFDLTLIEDDQHLFDSGSFDDGDTLDLGGDSSQPTWEDTADGVEGWGWIVSGDDTDPDLHIVNIFTWEFE